MSKRLTYANVMSTLAVVLVVAGGTAYAANTVFSSDIVNGEVKAADIGTDEVRSVDVRDDSLTGGGLTAADLRPGSVGPAEAVGLTGADIADVANGSDDVNADQLDGVHSGGLVKGRGRLLGARFIMQHAQPDRTLLEIPGLGRLDAQCTEVGGTITLTNTTNSDIDWWDTHDGIWSTGVLHPSGVLLMTDDEHPSTLALGFGDDPGARRTAIVDAFVKFVGLSGPCIFQAQGTLWTDS